jgi:Zn-dependent alcohol dehydrogenase
MMKTRAAVLRKGGEPWEITELDLDEPKDLMRGIVGQAFGVPSDAIDLTYPSTSEQER